MDDKLSELEALITLMDEPDEQIFIKVRKRIFDFGETAIPILENAWLNSDNTGEIKRIERLIEDILFNNAYMRLKSWMQSETHNLLEAYLIISRLNFNLFDYDNLMASVEKLFKDVWLEINDNLTALEKIKVVNHIFYQVYNFHNEQSEKPDVSLYYLDEVMRQQKGNHMSMAMLYLIITERLNLPVFGINLPKHFILAYIDLVNQVNKPINIYSKGDIMFYINPFNKGAVFTKSEIDLYLKQLNIKSKSSYYLPCDTITIVRRLLTELKFARNSEQNQRSVEMINTLLYLLHSRREK